MICRIWSARQTRRYTLLIHLTDKVTCAVIWSSLHTTQTWLEHMRADISPDFTSSHLTLLYLYSRAYYLIIIMLWGEDGFLVPPSLSLSSRKETSPECHSGRNKDARKTSALAPCWQEVGSRGYTGLRNGAVVIIVSDSTLPAPSRVRVNTQSDRNSHDTEWTQTMTWHCAK